MTAAAFAAADEERDALAWQIGRVVLGDAKSWDALRGTGAAAPATRAASSRAAGAQNLHAFRLWKRALSRKFGKD